MNNIKCPHCGTVFTINETEYSQLLAQVRSNEFDKEIHDRLVKEKTILEEKSKNDLQLQANLKDKEISELKSQLEHFISVKDFELTQALTEKDKELLDLSIQIKELKQSLALENQQMLSKKEAEITELKAQLENLSSIKDLELS